MNIKNSFLKKLRGDDIDNDDIATPPIMMEQHHKTQGRGNNKTNDGNELEKKIGESERGKKLCKRLCRVVR